MPALPEVSDPTWISNDIDRYILAELDRNGLRPSPPANRYQLVRRSYLDLIGLQPTPAEADEFVSDQRPDAYERLVDRLLASPHYGERGGGDGSTWPVTQIRTDTKRIGHAPCGSIETG